MFVARSKLERPSYGQHVQTSNQIHPKDLATLQSEQRTFLKDRDACSQVRGSNSKVIGCIDDAYLEQGDRLNAASGGNTNIAPFSRGDEQDAEEGPTIQPPTSQLPTPATVSRTKVSTLLGWREFHFGMSADEVSKVATIPLKCTDSPEQRSADKSNQYTGFTGKVQISNVNLDVAMMFENISPNADACSGGRLVEVSLASDSVSPCPARRLLSDLQGAYGPFLVHNGSMDVDAAPPSQFLKKFTNNAAIRGTVTGVNDSCEFLIEYQKLADPIPPPPSPPKSTF